MTNIIQTRKGDILLLVNVLAGEIIETLAVSIINTVLDFDYLRRIVTPIVRVVLRLHKSELIFARQINTLQFASPEKDVATSNENMFAIVERLK